MSRKKTEMDDTNAVVTEAAVTEKEQTSSADTGTTASRSASAAENSAPRKPAAGKVVRNKTLSGKAAGKRKKTDSADEPPGSEVDSATTEASSRQASAKKKAAKKRSARKKTASKSSGNTQKVVGQKTTPKTPPPSESVEPNVDAKQQSSSNTRRADAEDSLKQDTAEADMASAFSQLSELWFHGAQQAMEMSRQSTEISMELFGKASQATPQSLDPLNISDLFSRAGGRISMDPVALLSANQKLLMQQTRLWSYAAERMAGGVPEPVIDAERDKRFVADAWKSEPLFDVLKQNYLLLSEWMMEVIRSDDSPADTKEQARLEFFTRQLIDAMAPTNFAATNPEVMATTLDSNGQNLAAGLENLRRDIENGSLNIQQVDPEAFKVGRDIATTPGSVVYENELMQLIQYNPTTESVKAEPLLIIPPWINKFYILDLKPENSFIRWATAQGLTVFVVSWRNIDSSMRHTTFDDYLFNGVLDAVSAIEKATDVEAGKGSVHTIGYCIGGTLLACALAWMAKRDDNRIRTATFFAAQVDFSEPGDLGLFIDEQQISAVEGLMAERGYLDGAEMARTFNLLRSNDLIWSFWVNNYLLGRESLSFDLLFWNADSTRIPAPTHSFYLRQMYLHNNLVKPGVVELAGETLDLTQIRTPVYLQATREDHIAPWRSVFKAKHNYAGDVRFVLAGSGHIAGVVNPPQKQKYSYWVNDSEPLDAEQWLQGASESRGSWWPNWIEWIDQRSGASVPAREPGSGQLPVIEAAPGRYVLE